MSGNIYIIQLHRKVLLVKISNQRFFINSWPLCFTSFRLKCFLVFNVKINYDTVTFVNYVVKVVNLNKSQSGNNEFWIDK